MKFFGGNDQAFISKKQKSLAVKSIPFVLDIRKMSLLDNLKSKQIIDSKLLTFFGGNHQASITKSQKDLAPKSIPFVLKR